MGYDIGLYIDTGNGPVCLQDTDHNYTYNVAPMFVRAFRNADGINMLHGRLAEWCIVRMELAIAYMRENFGEISKHNPENGWGNAEGAIKFLDSILASCKQHPKAILMVT